MKHRASSHNVSPRSQLAHEPAWQVTDQARTRAAFGEAFDIWSNSAADAYDSDCSLFFIENRRTGHAAVDTFGSAFDPQSPKYSDDALHPPTIESQQPCRSEGIRRQSVPESRQLATLIVALSASRKLRPRWKGPGCRGCRARQDLQSDQRTDIPRTRSAKRYPASRASRSRYVPQGMRRHGRAGSVADNVQP